MSVDRPSSTTTSSRSRPSDRGRSQRPPDRSSRRHGLQGGRRRQRRRLSHGRRQGSLRRGGAARISASTSSSRRSTARSPRRAPRLARGADAPRTSGSSSSTRTTTTASTGAARAHPGSTCSISVPVAACRVPRNVALSSTCSADSWRSRTTTAAYPPDLLERVVAIRGRCTARWPHGAGSRERRLRRLLMGATIRPCSRRTTSGIA